MKLYATVTSERASKGQGGNGFLDIKLQYHINGVNAFYGCITLSEMGVLSFTDPLGAVRHIATLNSVGLCETKGEKQKGELTFEQQLANHKHDAITKFR